ncbi:hypothetical protein JCM24511_04267 [Saitozyma sp. JCM 24511]|nr:hypothetical protein JCM24511_04267 [Saitozyma sp. JCM 24511]
MSAKVAAGRTMTVFPGNGTGEQPFVVDFEENDLENPRAWGSWKKWMINMVAASTMMTGTFSVSAYASGISGMTEGPSLGPLLGGYVVQYGGSWRNIDWLAVPETFPPFILRRRAAKLQQAHGQTYVGLRSERAQYPRPERCTVSQSPCAARWPNPVPLLTRKSMREELSTHLKLPIKYLFTDELSVLCVILNLFFEAFPFIYSIERKWSRNAGLPFSALIVCFACAAVITLVLSKPYVTALKRDGKPTPELRLIFAMISAILSSLFWIGWSGPPGTSWAAPVIAGGVFGFGQIGLQMSTSTYLSDVYGMTVGAVFAAANPDERDMATQMYKNLGVSWASSTLGFILVAFAPAPFLLYVAAQRRALPRGRLIKEDYVFESAADGTEVRLSELFVPGKNSLVIYNMMFPRWSEDARAGGPGGNTAELPLVEQPCPSCTSVVNGLEGCAFHVAERTNLVVIARTSPDRLRTYAQERGWRHLRLLSSRNNTLNRDYHAETPDVVQRAVLHVF